MEKKLRNFFKQFKRQAFSKGEIIIQAESDPPGVFFLQKGFIRQYQLNDSGLETTMHFYGPGSFLPLTWALNNIPNHYFFQAFSDINTWLAPKDCLKELLINNPDILYSVTKRLLYGIDGLLTRIDNLVSADAYIRVGSVLLFLGRHFAHKNGRVLKFNFQFTHQDIANLVGVSRETVSRELGRLQEEGLISYQRHFLVIKKQTELWNQVCH